MKEYDASAAPDPQQWLSLDEQERIDLVRQYHQASRIKPPKKELHAVLHVIVENQLAMGLEAVVSAYHRLLDQGLVRHDAIHAIGWVVFDHLAELSSGRLDHAIPTERNERYYRQLSELAVEKRRND